MNASASADPLPTILASYGGRHAWEQWQSLEVECSVSGLLFHSKGLRPLQRQRLSLELREPRVEFHDYPERGKLGLLKSNDDVQILSGAAILRQRRNPRAAFFGPFRRWRWDELDVLYFTGYTLWQSLSLPLLLRDARCRQEILHHSQQGSRIALEFPDTLPSHCRRQILHFDGDGRLTRQDATAKVVGAWATTSQHHQHYQVFDGMHLATQQRERLRVGTLVLPLPPLLAVDIHEVRGIA